MVKWSSYNDDVSNDGHEHEHDVIMILNMSSHVLR